MDNVLVDFLLGIEQLSEAVRNEYADRLDEVPGIFSLMSPMPGAIDAFKALSDIYDTYICLRLHGRTLLHGLTS